MSLPRILFLALLPALLILGAHVVLHDWLVLDGRLVGPDAYMRVLRVLELAQGGSWYDPVLECSNAPFGEVLHWTRSLDVILLLLGLLFAVQFFITFQFALGRPDHHGLNILLFIWQKGFAFRLARVDCARNIVPLAALAAAFALWISIEGGLGTAMILAGLDLCLDHQWR